MVFVIVGADYPARDIQPFCVFLRLPVNPASPARDDRRDAPPPQKRIEWLDLPGKYRSKVECSVGPAACDAEFHDCFSWSLAIFSCSSGVGVSFPCSHAETFFTDTPSAAANLTCESFNALRFVRI